MRLACTLHRGLSRGVSPTTTLGCIESEKGTSLIIVLVCIAGIIALVALLIDLGIVYFSKSSQEFGAFTVGTKALQSYTSAAVTTTGPDEITERLNSAVSGSNQQLTSFLNSSFIAKFLREGVGTVQLGLPDTPGQDGVVSPGIWYFSDPGDCTTSKDGCPCKGTGSNAYWAGPCYKPLNSTEISDPTNPQVPNAMNVQLKIPDRSPFEPLLAPLLGQDSVAIASSATACFAPRTFIFLLDESRSAHSMTHLSVDRGPLPGQWTNGAESAYKLRDGVPLRTCVYNEFEPSSVVVTMVAVSREPMTTYLENIP